MQDQLMQQAEPMEPSEPAQPAAEEKARGVTAPDGTTKAKIERAALVMFAEHGVDAVTTREIASASGVSEGALYRHYPGKERLAETLFFTIHKKLAAEVRVAAAEGAPVHEQAQAVVRAYCRIADEDWPLFSYHLLTTHRFLPRAAEAQRADTDNPVAAVAAVIEAAMGRGDLPEGDSELKAAMALGVVLQPALHKVYGRIDGSLSSLEDELSNAVIAVLQS